jgi:hypothetical protein
LGHGYGNNRVTTILAQSAQAVRAIFEPITMDEATPINDSPLSWEGPYQVVLVAALVGLLLVFVMMPRPAFIGASGAPLGLETQVGLRTAALVLAAVLALAAPMQALWLPLLAWGAFTAPPLLFALALDGRLSGEPWWLSGWQLAWLLLAPCLLAIGLHGLWQRWPRWGWLVLLPLGLSLLLPAPWSVFGSLLEANQPPLWLGPLLAGWWWAWRRPI